MIIPSSSTGIEIHVCAAAPRARRARLRNRDLHPGRVVRIEQHVRDQVGPRCAPMTIWIWSASQRAARDCTCSDDRLAQTRASRRGASSRGVKASVPRRHSRVICDQSAQGKQVERGSSEPECAGGRSTHSAGPAHACAQDSYALAERRTQSQVAAAANDRRRRSGNCRRDEHSRAAAAQRRNLPHAVLERQQRGGTRHAEVGSQCSSRGKAPDRPDETITVDWRMHR